MPHGFWIRNARVIDPARGIDQVGDIVTRGESIVPCSASAAREAEESIDAAGCLVLPGLIDFHAHLAHRMTDTGVYPDLMALPNGITAAVDAGSVGTAGAEAFVRQIVGGSEITIKFFLNVSAMGVATERHPENPDPALFDADALGAVCQRHSGCVLGLKIRLGAGFSDGWGVRSLVRAKEIARDLGKPLCVHVTNPELPCADFLDLLEEGDILCHCFQGRGRHTILDEKGKVGAAARRARERNVIFDAAVGRINYDLEIAARALADSFPPDIISTDLVATSVYNRKLFHLLYVMSVFLALGMPLSEVVRACTATPAGRMGLAGRAGTLAPGAAADIAILRIRERPMIFSDQFGHSVKGEQLLTPLATLKAGRLVYKRIDFEY